MKARCSYCGNALARYMEPGGDSALLCPVCDEPHARELVCVDEGPAHVDVVVNLPPGFVPDAGATMTVTNRTGRPLSLYGAIIGPTKRAEVPSAESLRLVAALCDRERVTAVQALTRLHLRNQAEDVRSVALLEDSADMLQSVATWLRKRADENS